MSSHHVIREDQEPAILIFEVENCWESLNELLEWSPKVLVQESFVDEIESRQTKIDGFLKCSNPINRNNADDLHYSQDHFCKSLNQWLLHKNYTAINIFCDVDMLFNIITELEKTQLRLPLNVYTKLGRCIIKNGNTFKKWYPKETKVACLNEHQLPTFTDISLSKAKAPYPFDGIREYKSSSDFIILLEEIKPPTD